MTETELISEPIDKITLQPGAPPDYAAFVPFVQAVGRGNKLRRDLTRAESFEAMRLILRQKATPAQIGAFLIALRVKGESEEEIGGFTKVVRDEFIIQISPRVNGLLDLGVPYDGKVKTAQLIPAVAFILAAAGVPVVVHGDECVPTKYGITPGAVFSSLGVPTSLEPKIAEKMIECVGIGYLSAARFVPAWHALVPLRREFGLRTAMNSVEKLFNPANAPYHISGFFHGEYLERLRTTRTGTQSNWIVQGEEGSIEMAAGRPTHIFAANQAEDVILDPSAAGLPKRERIFVPPDVNSHTLVNAQAIKGERGSALDQAALTAGTILRLLGVANTLDDGIERARSVVISGAAQERLDKATDYGRTI